MMSRANLHLRQNQPKVVMKWLNVRQFISWRSIYRRKKKNPKQLNVFGTGHIVLDKIIAVEENEEKQLLSTK